MTNQIVDKKARESAINPQESFIVQAPAGSGKTELLTDRVLALLATVNRPEEIIAITFTRKAAAEMHARVMEKLKLGQSNQQPEKEYLIKSWQLAQAVIKRSEELNWDLLKNPARLKIRTIDAFCSYLIKNMPYSSAFGGMPEAASSEKTNAMYQQAAIQTMAMVDEQNQVKDLLDHLDVNQKNSIDLIVEMLGQRDQWLNLTFEPVDLEQLQSSLGLIISQDLYDISSSMPYGWQQQLQPILKQAANYKISISDENTAKSPITSFTDWDGSDFGYDIDAVGLWSDLAHVLLTGKDDLRKSYTKTLGFEAKSDYKQAMLDWLDQVQISQETIEKLAKAKVLPSQGYNHNQKKLLEDFLHVLMVAHAKLQLCFSANNQVDFIEIAQRALSALGTPDQPTDLLLVLDSKINHILVDEFQDTSHSQIELLETLVSGWQPYDGRSLFLVGDPMQSIYRFRKAEVGLFLKTRDHGLGGINLKPLDLQQNFRSRANLVESTNKLFVNVFPKNDEPDLGAIKYSKSMPFHSDDGINNLNFYPIYIDKYENPDHDSNNQNNETGLELDELATEDATVLKIVQESLDKYKNSDKPVAILVRSRNHLNNVVQLMLDAGIACKSIDIDSLSQQQVVSDIVQLARALSHKNDRLAWLSVLRSPLCGLSLDTLHKLFGSDLDTEANQTIAQKLQIIIKKHKENNKENSSDKKNYDNKASYLTELVDQDELHRILNAALVLLDTSNDSGLIPFAAWVQQCWQSLNGDAIYSNDNDRANAERAFELIEQLAPYGNLDFEEFDKAIENLYAQSSTTGPAVEIMTIHKSKGLEFESVIVMGLNRQAMADRSTLLDYEQIDGNFLLGPIKRTDQDTTDPISTFIRSRHKTRAKNELDRVLYVALTRARSELHLTAVINKKENGEPSISASGFLSRLYDGLTNMAQIKDVQMVYKTTEANINHKLLRQPINNLPVLEDLKNQLNTGPMDYSMNAWDWDTRRTPEQIIGTVAHDWLERIALDGLENWSVQRIEECQNLLSKHLSRAGILTNEMSNALFVLQDTLVKTLQSERGKWLLSVSQSYREWALLDLTGRVSIIDLAISQENQWLIVDYKTSVPGDGEPISVFKQRMLSTYAEQLFRYMQHVKSIDGRKAQAALYFPRVDLWLTVE